MVALVTSSAGRPVSTASSFLMWNLSGIFQASEGPDTPTSFQVSSATSSVSRACASTSCRAIERVVGSPDEECRESADMSEWCCMHCSSASSSVDRKSLVGSIRELSLSRCRRMLGMYMCSLATLQFPLP